MFSEIRPNCGSQKHASFFHMTTSKQTAQGEFYERTTAEFTEHEDCS